ncbi:MAG: HD domain-containing protein [Thermotogota bacterium]|nr:HD domain-containing protein [Thermotogota bacterium]
MIDQIINEIIRVINCKINYFYIVGGMPRDLILKNEINDVDTILPVPRDHPFFKINRKRQIKKSIGTVLKKINVNGISFKCEINPLQKEDIEQDLKSRDLTINSIAYKVDAISKKIEIFDPCGGINDLINHKLRCYQEKNLTEDPIRMLRIFRFQSLLNFDVDTYTTISISKYQAEINDAPDEMLYEEFSKLFLGAYCVKAFRNMANSGLLSKIIPEMETSIKFLHQDPYHHHESVFEHSLQVLDNCVRKNLGLEYRVAAFFHDISKPFVFDGKHYLKHETKGVKVTKKILSRMRFPNHLINNVSRIINYHMIEFNSQKKFFEVRYNIGENEFKDQIQFIEADKMATNYLWNQTQAFQDFIMNVNIVNRYDDSGFFERLEKLVNGKTLLRFGLKSGPGFQKVLDYLKKYFFKKPDRLSERNIKTLLEQNLFFSGHYNQFKYGVLQSKRIREYIKGQVIYGLLEESVELSFKSGIFYFNYFSKGEFINWEKENRKYCCLFY